MNSQPFQNNVSIITGAASGIGRELSLQLAEQGALLSLADLDAQGLETVADECRNKGAKILTVVTDIALLEQCQTLIQRTVDEYGRIDTLINNAGIAMFANVENIEDPSMIDKLMQINFMGSAYCTYYALPYLKQHDGRIIVVSSLAGKVGLPGSSVYAASKHALAGFFDSLRIELMDTDVSVSIIYPDFVATNLRKNMLGPDGKPMGKKTRASSKILTPEKCASLILKAGAKRQRETMLSLRGKLGPWLKLIAPGITDKMAFRSVKK